MDGVKAFRLGPAELRHAQRRDTKSVVFEKGKDLARFTRRYGVRFNDGKSLLQFAHYLCSLF